MLGSSSAKSLFKKINTASCSEPIAQNFSLKIKGVDQKLRRSKTDSVCKWTLKHSPTFKAVTTFLIANIQSTLDTILSKISITKNVNLDLRKQSWVFLNRLDMSRGLIYSRKVRRIRWRVWIWRISRLCLPSISLRRVWSRRSIRRLNAFGRVRRESRERGCLGIGWEGGVCRSLMRVKAGCYFDIYSILMV